LSLIRNRQELLGHAEGELRFAREVLLEVIEEVIRAADPGAAVGRFLKREGGKLEVGGETFEIGGKVVILGVGKAAASMVEAALVKLGGVAHALAVVPKGQGKRLSGVEVVEGEHPLPGEGSILAGRKVLPLLQNLKPEDLVLCLISGGGSAMLEVPPPSITLEDLRTTNELLLKCGANIHEINTVRKHLSLVKGGQLVRLSAPARVLSLMISDVPGDVKHDIASGPTEPDPTSFADAREVLCRYGLWEKVPQSVRQWIERGIRGEVEETPKPGERIFERYRSWIVASNSLALRAAAEVGKRYHLRVSLSELSGEAREMGVKMAREKDRGLHLWGGETTVTVRGPGKGGRNQELVLAASPYLADRSSALFSIGTDGIDGQTDAAGAMADGETVERVRKLGLDFKDFLERNDSYHFFKALGDLILTGPTGTNVMDVAGLVNL
jgi:glycerate-2-kinase